MIKPDIFFALDASPANDMSGDKSEFGQLGKGALLRIFDRTMVTHRGMREFILDTACAQSRLIWSGRQRRGLQPHSTGTGPHKPVYVKIPKVMPPVPLAAAVGDWSDAGIARGATVCG